MTSGAVPDPVLPTVVIPVFNAPEETAHCLSSVLAHTSPSASVLVINDASTDPEIEALLLQWAGRAPASWRIERNPENLGFVGTANRGLNLAGGDIVLLNSDAVATRGWLQGLALCLQSDPDIATATPWTNNGEIASIPVFCQDNPVPDDPDAVAVAVRQAGPPDYPELPTAVGFCMAIARRAIDRVGVFEASVFGRGYGEENDFSMRARQAGMRNVLCDDTYVVHLGGRSFGPLGLRPDESSMQRLLDRHPDYLERVMDFIRQDPLAPRRRAVLAAIERAGLRLG